MQTQKTSQDNKAKQTELKCHGYSVGARNGRLLEQNHRAAKDQYSLKHALPLLHEACGNQAVTNLLQANKTENFDDSFRSLISSTGQALNAGARKNMEEKFQHDFSDVIIHTGPNAKKTADSLDATALTYRNHVVFGDASDINDHTLLAHELAHVIQQRGQTVTANVNVNTNPVLEADADAAATMVSSGNSAAQVNSTAPASIQCFRRGQGADNHHVVALRNSDLQAYVAINNLDNSFDFFVGSFESDAAVSIAIASTDIGRQYRQKVEEAWNRRQAFLREGFTPENVHNWVVAIRSCLHLMHEILHGEEIQVPGIPNERIPVGDHDGALARAHGEVGSLADAVMRLDIRMEINREQIREIQRQQDEDNIQRHEAQQAELAQTQTRWRERAAEINERLSSPNSADLFSVERFIIGADIIEQPVRNELESELFELLNAQNVEDLNIQDMSFLLERLQDSSEEGNTRRSVLENEWQDRLRQAAEEREQIISEVGIGLGFIIPFFLEGVSVAIPASQYQELENEVSDNEHMFTSGILFGISEGLGRSLLDNIEGLWTLIWAFNRYLSPIGIQYEIGSEISRFLNDPSGHGEHRFEQAQQVQELIEAINQFISYASGNPEILAELSRELGINAGVWFSEDYMQRSTYDKGNFIGVIAGRAVMEILLIFISWETLAVRGVTEASRALNVSGRLRSIVLRIIDDVPALARFFREGRIVSRNLDEAGGAVRVVDEAGDIGQAATQRGRSSSHGVDLPGTEATPITRAGERNYPPQRNLADGLSQNERPVSPIGESSSPSVGGPRTDAAPTTRRPANDNGIPTREPHIRNGTNDIDEVAAIGADGVVDIRGPEPESREVIQLFGDPAHASTRPPNRDGIPPEANEIINEPGIGNLGGEVGIGNFRGTRQRGPNELHQRMEAESGPLPSGYHAHHTGPQNLDDELKVFLESLDIDIHDPSMGVALAGNRQVENVEVTTIHLGYLHSDNPTYLRTIKNRVMQYNTREEVLDEFRKIIDELSNSQFRFEGFINLNTANADEIKNALRGLGVGEILSQRIVQKRAELGGSFDNLDQLLEINGLGDETFDRILPFIDIRLD